MARSICITCLMLLVGIPVQVVSITYDENTKRHHIYWDSKVSKSIRDPDFALKVEIGQFMDIICPFTNYGLTEDPEPPSVFDLYNVTEEGFMSCDPTVPGARRIFKCDLPDQENKLTVKFQRISPSPYGFRFRHCEEYYFIAIKRDSVLAPPRGHRKYGCSRESERLRIKIGCPHESTTSTTTTTTTTSTTSTSSLINKMMGDSDVIVPSLNPVEEDDQPKGAARAHQSSDSGENGSTRTVNYEVKFTLFISLITTTWMLNSFFST